MKTNPKINYSQAFLGMCLGDAHLRKQHKYGNVHIELTHGDSQINYLKHKTQVLGDFISGLIFKGSKIKVVLGDKVFNSNRARSNVHPRITKYYDLIYDNKKKIITKTIVRRLGYCGLSYWYGDDGTLLQKKEFRKDGSFYWSRPLAELCTDNFSYEENVNLCLWLNEFFGFIPIVVKRKAKRNGTFNYRLRFTVLDTYNLISIVKPYLINIGCLRHKVIPKRKNYFTDGYPNNQPKNAQHQ